MVGIARYAARLGTSEHRIASLLPAEPAAEIFRREARVPLMECPSPGALRQAIADADIVQLHFWNSPELYDWLHRPWPAMRLLGWIHVAGTHAPQLVTPDLVRHCDFALASCELTGELPVMRDLPKDRTATILDAADFSRLAEVRRLPHTGFNVGYIGTLESTKMHPDFITMSAATRLPDARFLVCGGGPGLGRLKREAADHGVAERFDFRGYVADIAPVLGTLDVFGYPLCEHNYATAELVLQEAMYAGVPPVIFDYGGARGTVENGRTGLVVKSASEYRDAIEYLYHHPAERIRIGEAAANHARTTYGAENAARAFEALYHRMMETPKQTRPPLRLHMDGPDRIPIPEGSLGSDLFISSLGTAGEDFVISKYGRDASALLEADRRISSLPPPMRSSATGGIRHYRNSFPADPYLRLWSALLCWQEKTPVRALAELDQALSLGLSHWRISWYIARLAASVNARELEQRALAQMRRRGAAPSTLATEFSSDIDAPPSGENSQ